MTTTFKTIFEASAQKQDDAQAWLKQHGYDKYKIVNGLIITNKHFEVDGDENFTEIAFPFGKITHKFDVSSCPKLKSLKNSPEECKDFEAHWCDLRSLEGGPKKVNGDYSISSNKNLGSLKGCPVYVGGSFYAMHCGLKEIDDFPEFVQGNVSLHHNKLTSLKDIHKTMKSIGGTLHIGGNPIKSHILGLLMIENLSKVSAKPRNGDSDPRLESAVKIINKYLRKGRQGMFDATSELVENDLDEFAEI